jgi:MFS family permease
MPSRDLRPFIKLPRGLAPLGYKNFALYWVGLATSNAGTWVELTGVVWLVFELTNSAALLGLLGLFRGAPVIILGPLAGVVADRVDQRRLLLATQAAALIASLSLCVVVAAGLVELWHIYLQVAVQAVVQTFDAAARQAMFPRLVPRSYRAEAVTLTVMAGRTAKFIGPSVGGIAIASFGVATPFLLNALTFLALMAAVVLIRGVSPRTATAGSSIRSELTAGARYIMDAPVVGGLLKMEAVFALFQLNPVMITIIGRQVLDVGPEGLGGLLSAPGFGALAGLAYLLIVGHTMRQGRFLVF